MAPAVDFRPGSRTARTISVRHGLVSVCGRSRLSDLADDQLVAVALDRRCSSRSPWYAASWRSRWRSSRAGDGRGGRCCHGSRCRCRRSCTSVPLFSAWAMQSVPAAHGAVVIGLLPLATAMAGAWIAHERPSRLFWWCAMFGSAVVVGFALWRGGGAPQPADGLLVLAVASASPQDCLICWTRSKFGCARRVRNHPHAQVG